MQQMQENLRLQQQMLQDMQTGAGGLRPVPAPDAHTATPAAEPVSPTQKEQQWW